jgi:uncharacterized protein
MVIEVKKQVCDGKMLKWLLAAGCAWLEYNQERVNQMNVFPVPDGDTGTNMCLTMEKAYNAIVGHDEPHAGIVSEEAARGALKGARGNSGVILSQLLRGFAQVMRGHEVFDVKLLVEACQSGVDAAYKAVLEPTEGTILTVARESTEALVKYARSSNDLIGALDTLLAAARTSLENTPDLLPILKKAGVVDSGGLGLVFMLEGMQRMLNGEPVYMGERGSGAVAEQGWQEALIPEDEEGYGYDVQFLMAGQGMDVDAVRAAIDTMGWSTLVVGDENLIKVHVHVHDPGEPLSYAIKSGAAIDDIVVENMQLQYEDYVQQREKEADPPAARQVDGVAVVVVANGEGLRELFYDGLNAAAVISGGQTMNPSAEDFLSVIDALENDEVILLPNNRNIILAAQQAAALARDKHVRVVTTKSLPQGISAMLAYMDCGEDGDLDSIVAAMQEARSLVVTCEVTTANRDASLNGLSVKQGQFIGLADDNLVAAGDDLTGVVRDVLRAAKAERHELITLYYGDTIDQAQAAILAEALSGDFPDQQIEVVQGGQPLYPYVISVE